MKNIILLALSLISSTLAFAQGEAAGGGMMVSHHKMPVVVAVLAVILLLIFVFLFSLERRLKKLEEKQE